MDVQDVIIVGGGPAGLSAAVVLGRCLRKVLVFDTAQYRNKYSHGMHNYLTRDDILPNDFINICHQEIAKYSVQLIPKKVVRARKNGDGIFVVKDQEDQTYYAKKMLIATGLVDKVPTVQGFKEMYGKSVFHCPYCDGWEVKGKRVGVYARNKEGWELALSLKAWTNDVTLYTDGRNKVKPFQKEYLEANEIPIVKAPFAHLEGDNGQLKKIVFTNGEEAPCDAIFFVNGYEQRCDLAETFDCEISSKGVVVTNRFQQTNTTGLYVAGDADKDVHFVVVAAAEGAKAGVTINKELQKEIMEQKLREVRTKQLIT
jgi:thioredoxin reductase